MTARTKRRAAERTRLNAAICQVPLSDWVTMPRRARRRRVHRARKRAGRG